MMICGAVSFSLFRKIGQSHCCQFAASYRRAVMPVNTYYRFKQGDKSTFQPQNFKYFLVLDFEATCDDVFFPEMEIIEFPCLKVDASTFQTLDIFHTYVRPVKHPLLTPFCTNLTGIDQEMVDDKLPFSEVLTDFLKWLEVSDTDLMGPHPNSAFVTSGDWDLVTMLPNQCQLSGIPIPSVMKSWINIKQSFLKATGLYPHGIKDMLLQLKLKHEGRLHSGISDCQNIVKIMKGVAERGHVFTITRTLQNHEEFNKN